MNRIRSNSDNVMIALRKIIQVIDKNSKSLFRRIGLTGPQLVILQEIDEQEKIHLGELAKEVSLSQATVTSILERLESRKLVVKQRSEDDRRRVFVSTTKAGKQLLENAPPLMQEAFVEHFNQLQDWEQTSILSSLQHLVAIMKARAISASPYLETLPMDAICDGEDEMAQSTLE